MFTRNKRVVCFYLFMLCAAVSGEPIEYNLLQLCNTTIDTFSSALLKIDGWWWSSSDTCSVRVHAVHNRDSQVRLEVLDLQALCGLFSLTLYDGTDKTARQISPGLCGDNWKRESMYLTNGDTVTITLTSARTPGDGMDATVSLLATSICSDYMYGDFECYNYLNVISGLTCDGYNNCGDWSDESRDVCSHWKTVVAGTVGGSVFVAIVTIVIIVIWRRRRATRTRLCQSMAKGRNDPAPPAYGSLQGELNPVYNISPHSYSGEGAPSTLPSSQTA